MSSIYVTEPPTNGKVLLKTTVGEVDIELWSKETPLACRNFVQLCLEGYYNGTVIHRIVKDFIAQCGDPTRTGEGGESIYGHTFKDEYHSRLKFSRRGLVGMANVGKDDNGSQFFFTLGRTDELTNKHTLFGKVTGSTLYNMIRLNDVATDKEEHPIEPVPKILKAEVLSNPFDDIVPRIDPRKLKKSIDKIKSQSKSTKNFSLLSFGEEAEEDEEQTLTASKDMRIKSSHDVLTDDSKLSAQPAVEPSQLRREKGRKRKGAEGDNDGGSLTDEDDNETEDSTDKSRHLKESRLSSLEERIRKEQQVKIDKRESLKLQTEQLKRELRQAKKKREAEKEEIKAKKEDLPDAIKSFHKEQAMYRIKKTLGKGGNREDQTLDLLSKFKSKLSSVQVKAEDKVTEDSHPEDGMETAGGDDGIEIGPDLDWLGHHLAFDSDGLVKVKDASVLNEDTFDIYDPRNPLNKRRRETDKKEKNKSHRKHENSKT